MTSNLIKYEDDLKKLINLGDRILKDIGIQLLEKGKSKLTREQKEIKKEVDGSFENDYQKFYTESIAVIRQLMPDRQYEFLSLYKGDGRRKEIKITTYTIQDWVLGVRAPSIPGQKKFNELWVVFMNFKTQLALLKSIKVCFKSCLFDIKQLLQADLFDSEIDRARELLKNGFFRGTGIIAGVILETHLSQVVENHNEIIRKKDPTINDYNDLLKKNNVIDLPKWQFIQHLSDIRNLCAHKKQQDPKKEDVLELIDGVEKTIKTLF